MVQNWANNITLQASGMATALPSTHHGFERRRKELHILEAGMKDLGELAASLRLPSELVRTPMFIDGKNYSGADNEWVTRKSPGHGVPVTATTRASKRICTSGKAPRIARSRSPWWTPTCPRPARRGT